MGQFLSFGHTRAWRTDVSSNQKSVLRNLLDEAMATPTRKEAIQQASGRFLDYLQFSQNELASTLAGAMAASGALDESLTSGGLSASQRLQAYTVGQGEALTSASSAPSRTAPQPPQATPQRLPASPKFQNLPQGQNVPPPSKSTNQAAPPAPKSQLHGRRTPTDAPREEGFAFSQRTGLTREFGKLDFINSPQLLFSPASPDKTITAAPKKDSGRFKISGKQKAATGKISRNSKGEVSEISYADGSKRALTYRNGRLISVIDKDTTVWNETAPGLWMQFLPNGSASGNIWEGSVSVDTHGNYIYEDSTGSRVLERIDGSRLIEEPTGGTIETDTAGHIINLFYFDGTVRQLKHDAQGVLIEIKDLDGTTLTSTGKDNWVRRSASGEVIEQIKGSRISVDNEGDFVVENTTTGAILKETLDKRRISQGADGYAVTEHHDQSREVECPDGTHITFLLDGTIITRTPSGCLRQKPDGSRIESNLAGNVTKVSLPNGKSRELSYDIEGNVFRFRDTDESVWIRCLPDKWVQFDDTLSDSGRRRKGTLAVEESGDIIFHEIDRSMTFVYRTNCTSAIKYANGSQTELGADKKRLGFISVTGRKFQLSDDGMLRYEAKEGETIEQIAADFLAYAHRNESDYTVPINEIMAMTKKIERENWGGKTGTLKDKDVLLVKLAASATPTSEPMTVSQKNIALSRATREESEVDPDSTDLKTVAPDTFSGEVHSGEVLKPEELKEACSSWQEVHTAMTVAGATTPVAPVEQNTASKYHPNGTRLEYDEFGKVVRIEYSDGTDRLFSYNDKGDCIEIAQSTGRKMRYTGENEWTMLDENDEVLKTTHGVRVRIKDNGDIVTTHLDTGNDTIQRVDSCSIRVNKDRQLLLFLTPSGRRFSVIAPGIAKYSFPEGEVDAEQLIEDLYRVMYWNFAYQSPNETQMEECIETIKATNRVGNILDLMGLNDIVVPINSKATMASQTK